jgi:hypothetical protein
VRRHILQLAAVAVLLVVFGSHISELLDHWDNTLQTGNDIESAVIVLALTSGSVLVFAGAAVVSIARTRISLTPSPIVRSGDFGFIPLPVATHSPPLPALRI